MKKAIVILCILIAALGVVLAAIFIIDSSQKKSQTSSESGQTVSSGEAAAGNENGNVSEGQDTDNTQVGTNGTEGAASGNSQTVSSGSGSNHDGETSDPDENISAQGGNESLNPGESLSSVNTSRFSEQELKLIKEMIFDNAQGNFSDSKALELESLNTDDAHAIVSILSYWDQVEAEGFVNSTANGGRNINEEEGCPLDGDIDGALLPDGLADDDSLCIVGLGFELNSDGTIKDELYGRLETIRACAIQYPNAYILVTGGPTALLERNATEADAMARWLVENGVDSSRIIVENHSLTSATNALYSYEILFNKYPQVTDIAIVTSDYHAALGSLLFEAQFEMARAAGDDTGLKVVANAVYTSDGRYGFTRTSEANWLWILVQEQVASEHDIPGDD